MAERKQAEPVTPPVTDETRTRRQAEAEAARDDAAKARTKAAMVETAVATGTPLPPEPRGGYPPVGPALPGQVSTLGAEHTAPLAEHRLATPAPVGRMRPYHVTAGLPDTSTVSEHFEVLRQALIADPRLKAKVMSLARQLQHNRIGPFTDFLDAITAS